MNDWLVYILLCGDGSLYTGITNHLERRLNQHSAQNGGAKYLRGRLPLTVLYQECGHNRSSALKRERAIKSLSRSAKLALISENQALKP